MASGAPCSVCPGEGDTITLPDKEISVPGYEFIKDCAALDGLVPALLQHDTAECQTIQELGTLCGCPRKPNTCDLCPDGSKVGNPDLQVPILFQDQFQGITPTCELFEAYLHNVDESNSTCSLGQQVLKSYCGCSAAHDSSPDDDEASCSLCSSGEDITFPNKTLDIQDFPLSNCQELNDAAWLFLEESSETCSLLQSMGTFCGCNPLLEDGCNLCRDGSAAPDSSKPLPFLEKDFGFIPTYGLLEAVMMEEPANSNQCTDTQLFGSYCGCKPRHDHCDLCDPGDMFMIRDKELPQFEKHLGFTPTCELVMAFQFQIDAASDLCENGYRNRWRCGCNSGHYDYLDADTVEQQAVLAWLPRATALLSICGSLFVLWDIVSKGKKKLQNTYCQLFVAIAAFDVINSIAWAFTTLPIPRYDEFGEQTNIYGASGTQATCTAQGFFIQLGYTGMFYQIALTCYYVLVIVFSWKERQLQKIQKWLHIVPLVSGLALAFAGIPFYEPNVLACWIAPPPLAIDYTNILAFGIVPICFAILFTTVAMIAVYWKVRKDSRVSSKWRRGQPKSKKVSLESQVFYQSLFYVLAFWLSWPILIAANVESQDTGKTYAFWVVFSFVVPIQGFINCLVYLRPRLVRSFGNRRAAEVPPPEDATEPRCTSCCRGRTKVLFVYHCFKRDTCSDNSYEDAEMRLAADDLDEITTEAEPKSRSDLTRGSSGRVEEGKIGHQSGAADQVVQSVVDGKSGGPDL